MVKAQRQSKRYVSRISFERGRTKNGGITETKLFKLLPSGRDEKLRPNQTSNNRRTNQGMDSYLLLSGRYRIETKVVKEGRIRFCSAILVIEKDMNARVEDSRGDFLPQFFLS